MNREENPLNKSVKRNKEFLIKPKRSRSYEGHSHCSASSSRNFLHLGLIKQCDNNLKRSLLPGANICTWVIKTRSGGLETINPLLKPPILGYFSSVRLLKEQDVPDIHCITGEQNVEESACKKQQQPNTAGLMLSCSCLQELRKCKSWPPGWRLHYDRKHPEKLGFYEMVSCNNSCKIALKNGLFSLLMQTLWHH